MIKYTFDEKDTQEIINMVNDNMGWEEIAEATHTNVDSVIEAYLYTQAKDIVKMKDEELATFEEIKVHYGVYGLVKDTIIAKVYMSEPSTHDGEFRVCPVCGQTYKWASKRHYASLLCSPKCSSKQVKKKYAEHHKSTNNEFKREKKAKAEELNTIYDLANNPMFHYDDFLDMYIMKEEYANLNLKKFRKVSMNADKSYGEYVSDRECEEAAKRGITHQTLNELNHKTWCESQHSVWEVSAL